MGNLNIYVNGILTDRLNAIGHKDRLENMIGRPVQLFYNHTEGVLNDLLECVKSRNGTADISQYLASHLVVESREKETIRLFCHSQGGLIVEDALYILPDNIRQKIELIAFATAQTSEPGQLKHAEYFYNSNDILLSTGVFKYGEDWQGVLYKRESNFEVDLNSDGSEAEDYISDPIKEHDFIESYLNKFLEFKGIGNSLFCKLIANAEHVKQ